ncbi:MAG TPA: N-acetylmuramoyl-L-alanine amidase [Myxococcota bacterium]|nr:N-acetylmuramoyl-L-alanine amidase [Myxococcota bacterium]
MRRGPWALLLVAAAAAVAAAAGADESAEAAAAVVVDAGHGGADFGARGVDGTLEKDLTLAVARKLAAELSARNVRVVLTRDGDEFVPLATRTEIANKARARMYVSIHANSAPEPEVFGTETYFLSVDASDAEAMRVALTENDVYQQEGTASDSRDVVGTILGDLIRTEHLRESSDLAATLQRGLAKLPGESRGVKQAPFVVLTGVNMPAALVEIGFVTNAAEVQRLGRRDVQTALAKALAAALIEAMGQTREMPASRDEP